MLYAGTGDVREKTFWQCTGLEEEGWITPDVTTSPAPSSKTRLEVWALKGNQGQYCKFTLAGDRIGEAWALSFEQLRGWNQHDGVAEILVRSRTYYWQ